MIDDQYIVRIHPTLESDTYKAFDGLRLHLPKVSWQRPSLSALQHHRTSVFGKVEETSTIG
jgi:hypothetical protein